MSEWKLVYQRTTEDMTHWGFRIFVGTAARPGSPGERGSPIRVAGNVKTFSSLAQRKAEGGRPPKQI